MRRRALSILCAVLLLAVSAKTSSALTFTAIATAPGPYAVGEEVTIEVRVSADLNEQVGALGSIAFGWEPDIIAFDRGEAVGSAFNTGVLDAGGDGLVPVGGITNGVGTAGAAVPNHPLAPVNRNIGASDVIAPEVVEFFSGVQATLPNPIVSDENDLGIDGLRISDGGLTARLVFDVIGLGDGGTAIEIDIGFQKNFAIINPPPGPPNVVIPIVVIPEPSTAVLVGFGLLALGRSRAERDEAG